jgi:hypothetical protein
MCAFHVEQNIKKRYPSIGEEIKTDFAQIQLAKNEQEFNFMIQIFFEKIRDKNNDSYLQFLEYFSVNWCKSLNGWLFTRLSEHKQRFRSYK